MNYKVVAVVVTFNKLALLRECLSGLLDCKDMLSNIVIVNNASTDNTKDYLENLSNKEPLVTVQTEQENLGGAAGFNIGIKIAMSKKPDAMWVMDNDTIPNKQTLEKLLQAKSWLTENDLPWGVLASNVRWIDGTAAKMNIPLTVRNWNTSQNKNLVQIEHSSFVSMFINAEAVKKVGYPISDFFIWGDDLEFSRRIALLFPSYCVVNSLVIHKMDSNQKVDIFTDSEKRIPRYYYDVRNNFYISKHTSFKAAIKYTVSTGLKIVKVLFHGNNKRKKFSVMFRGFFAGLLFNPSIEQYNEDKE